MGSWTNRSVLFAQLRYGEVFFYNGTLTKGSLSGSLERGTMRGSWKCHVKRLILNGRRGLVPDLPEPNTIAKHIPFRHFGVGFFRCIGAVTNNVTHKKSHLPPLLLNMHSSGALVGKTKVR